MQDPGKLTQDWKMHRPYKLYCVVVAARPYTYKRWKKHIPVINYNIKTVHQKEESKDTNKIQKVEKRTHNYLQH